MMLQTMNTSNAFGAVPCNASSLHRMPNSTNLTKRLAMLAAILISFALGARAADYVITYTSGGTTYYLGMDGNNLKAKTTFDLTCIWTCLDGNTETTLGNQSRSLRNRNNNTYYLTTSCEREGNWYNYTYNWNPLSVRTSANAIWRSSNATNGNVYAYYSTGSGWNAWNRSASINVQSLSMIDNNTNSSKNYQVTITDISTTSTNPTINGADVLTATGNSTYTATGAAYRAGGYTNYRFNDTDHYFNGNTVFTPVAATIGSYSWSLGDNSYATVNSTSGVVTVSSLPQSDLTLTLTVTATVTGGAPAAPAGTTLVGSKEITILGSVPEAPTISVSGTTVTIKTDAPGETSIRYTIDGTNPTTTTGMVYSGTFNLDGTTSPVTIKAVTVRNGNVSAITTQVVTLTLPAPLITFDAEAGTATISSSIAGATIYYTTDGSDPTITSSQYTGTLTGLVTMTTIKAIAVKNGWNNSPVASALLTISSGVDGEVVTLFDYEDHNWSYYSDPDCPIHSWNPADVKITYYGNGSNTVATTNDDNPTSFTADATGVKVGIDADANTFIYYKTLERTDGSTAAAPNAATGRCAYTTIPNPFSVRPTYGSGNTRWRGFYKWRVKKVSGGTIHSASTGGATYAQGSTIDAEEDIYFAPNSEYGMEVEFEALWAQAYVTEGTGNLSSPSNSYERNFHVVTSSTSASSFQKSYPLTVTSRYPDGSNGGGSISGAFTASSDTKFENITITGATNSTWTANGHDLIVGRGCSGTVRTVRGMNGGSSDAVDYTIRLESGTYSVFALIDNSAHTYQNTISTKAVFGCDYDRAKGDNSLLSVSPSNTIYGGNASHTFSNATNRNNLTYDWLIKSGTVQKDYNAGDGAAERSLYMGNSISGEDGVRYCGKRRLTMEGGEVLSIAGSVNAYGNPDTYRVNDGGWSVMIRLKGGLVRGAIYGAAAYAGAAGDRRLIFTGGTVNGWVAGGANGTEPDGGKLTGASYVYVGGNAQIDSKGSDAVINRAVGGNVFGAGCGYSNSSESGQVTLGTNVVIADDAYVERGVYGGGSYGYTTETSNIYVLGGTVGGKNGGVNGTTYQASITGGVFGGACQNRGGTVNIYMDGGLVEGGVYGGSNVTGTLSGSVTMNINGGQVGTSSAPANIHGGGYGQATRVSGNVDITLGTVGQASDGVTVYGDVYGGSALGYVNGTTANDNYHTYVTLNEGTINGSLYGGGLGSNTVAANVYGPVKVTVNGGSVKTTDGTGENGSGGVYGANNIYGAPQSSVTVDIYGTDPAPAEGQYALHSVYGGGNKAPYNGTPIVTVHKCDNSIEYVYGGGNAASVNSTNVTIWGGNKIGNVFGGGNGTVSAANVNGDATTKIYGGTILNVFGGSNSQGTIGGTINVTVNSQAENGGDTPCTMNIGDVYGGGNRAASNVGNLNIVCTGTDGYINRVFGGANAAKITGNIELAINGGNIGSVFGGNNSEKSIEGNVTVNIGTAPNACSIFEIGNVHGGGYGKATGVTGNVEVNIAGGTINGDVYGGSALGKVNTSTSNTTAVNLTGGVIHGDAYGGGLGDSDTEADVNGNVTVTLNGTAFTLATTTDDKGNSIPTSGRIFGCNNINGSPKGTVLVKVLQTVAKNSDGTTKDKPTKGDGIYELQAVYGGGNLAAYKPTNQKADGQFASYTYGGNDTPHDNKEKPVQVVIDGCDLSSIEYVYGGGNAAATPATDVTVLGSYEIGSVFGGGNGKDRYTLDGGANWNENKGADVGIIDAAAYATDKSQGKYGTGDAMTSVLGGTVHNIYGGSNTRGNIVGSATAYLDAASDCKLNAGDIYGGGNEAYMDGNSGIQLGCIEYLKEIYGGARNADVGGDINLTITSGHFDRVFGGNNLGGLVKGSITVNIEETGCNPITIGELYGCGNKAPYTTPGDRHPTINIRSFTSIGNVYGGGLGKEAVVTGNPTVNINVSEGANSEVDWSYNGSTIDFGGGITVTLPVHEKGKIGAIGNVFGGGNAAAVIGNTQVNIGTEASKSADIRGNVYGGGNQADVTGQTNVVIGG